MKSFEAVLAAIENLSIGTAIPKPMSSDSSKVAGWGKRRGSLALIYEMPNHSNPAKPHKKGVTIDELRHVYSQLLRSGEFTRAWFKENMPACNEEGACNFTTLGGLFELVGAAAYVGRGRYERS